MARNFELGPSPGARLGYHHLAAAQLVLDPVQEIYAPTIHRASATPQFMTVHPFNRFDHNWNAGEGEYPIEIFLVREVGAEQAYALIDHRPAIVVGRNRHPEWGQVRFAFVCSASGLNVFQAPDPTHTQFVAIKLLNKRIVDRYLALGGEENPYKEMARMEELREDTHTQHVLRPIEFLEDDDYLYIVTPMASEEGTLLDVIPWFDNVINRTRVPQIFRKILRILGYLERSGINHHDLSPDNFLFLTPNNLVVFDLAMSVRIPINPTTGQRTLIAPQGRFGTCAWMDPMVYFNQVYDGVAMDLWAGGVILYNLLTSQILFEQPTPTDLCFRYFILARGLSANPLNNRAEAELLVIRDLALADNDYRLVLQRFIDMTTAQASMGPQAIELLENLLNVNPGQRYTLAQAMESAYVQEN